MDRSEIKIHPTADVAPSARIGAGTVIWHRAQVREGVKLGAHCIVGKDVYIDVDVVIGSMAKIQNAALIYHGATLEDGVFVGPQACLANDRLPRAVTPDGTLKTANDWTVGKTIVRYGASIGAGAIILPGVELGSFAMIGAGAVVVRSVPPFGLVRGVPARLVGYVCVCGAPLEQVTEGHGLCTQCRRVIDIGGGDDDTDCKAVHW